MDRVRASVRSSVLQGHPLDWAAVDVDVDADWILGGAGYALQPPRGSDDSIVTLGDVLVPDAAWYQVLTAGHLDRLGGLPAGARVLREGVAELTLGSPEQWLPGHPDAPTLRTEGRALLSALLVEPDPAFTLSRERMAAARARDTTGFFRT
jgi:hypothetical protein